MIWALAFLGLLAVGPPVAIGLSELISWIRRRRARRRRWFNGR